MTQINEVSDKVNEDQGFLFSESGKPFKSKGDTTLAIFKAKYLKTHDAVEVKGGWIGKKREVPVIESSEHDQKKSDRVERYKDRAIKANTTAEAHHNQSNNIAERFAGGQPILVGHHSEKKARNDQNRMHNSMRKSIEATEKSKYYNEKAVAVESNTAISSDDSNALILLKEKLRTAEQNQEFMKAINKIIKAKKLTELEKIKKITDSLGVEESKAKDLLEPDSCGRVGFASYKLTNNNANIKRMKDRVKKLEKQAQDETTEYNFEGGKILDNVEKNRVQILYDFKPDEDIRTILKCNGFKWSPREGAWQRFRSYYALYLAKEITGVK